MVACGCVLTSMRTATSSPGHRLRSALSKRALSVICPTVGVNWLSTNSSSPSASGAGRREVGGALQIDFGARELRFLLCDDGLRLVDLGLEREGVDDREQFALLDRLAFGERHALQLTVDARMHADRVERGDRADRV